MPIRENNHHDVLGSRTLDSKNEKALGRNVQVWVEGGIHI
jgi:hypothetical protein